MNLLCKDEVLVIYYAWFGILTWLMSKRHPYI